MVAVCRTFIVQNPEIGADIRPIEQVLGQGNDGIKEILIEKTLADVAPSPTGITIEQG